MNFLLPAIPALLAAVLAMDLSGLVGSLLSAAAPAATTILTSLIVYLANHAWGWIRDFNDSVKYLLLAVIGQAVAYGVHWLGGSIGADPSAWTQTTAEGVAAAVVGAVIFKIGHAAGAQS